MNLRHFRYFVLEVLLIVWFADIHATVMDTNYIAGVQLMQKGAYSEALKRLEKAHRTNPADARIAFDYARVAPCSIAIALYTRLALETKTPDSLRAASYIQLGDYSFVHSAFKTAAEKYRLATTIVDDPQYRHLRACASAALHDTATARSIWHTLTLEYGSDLASQAPYHLGLLDISDESYDSAYSRFTRAGKLDSTKSWTIAATAAKLECATRLGKTDSIKILEKQLQPFHERLLEKDLLGLAAILADKKPAAGAPTTTAATATPDSTAYTLQVGAFGSLDNATSLQRQLMPRFKEVTILPVTLSEQVFYRVRIGTFKSKNAAEAFGKDSLSAAGITFKAVAR